MSKSTWSVPRHMLLCSLVIASCISSNAVRPVELGQAIFLNGSWEFRADASDEGVKNRWYMPDIAGKWKACHVPGAWEHTQGDKFDGIGWYRKKFEIPKDWAGSAIWLEFKAVATLTKVWINGKEIGTHTGAWTPFRFDISDLKSGEDNLLVVRVDEKVGHTTQGFIPQISLHFGGIWQDVLLYKTSRIILSPHPLIQTKPAEKKICIETQVIAKEDAPNGMELVASVANWKEEKILASARRKIIFKESPKANMEIVLPDVKLWDTHDPHLYSISLTLQDSEGKIRDKQVHRIGMRTFEVKERQFMLNGQPIYLRGVLHWGYYPDLIAPVPDEKAIRKEITDMKSLGYNMIKVCMFLFPERYYDIADEMGMLVWQEYPVWLKPIRQKNRNELIDEFTEYYLQDRNRASIVLRDITCENEDIDAPVMKELYDLGKRLVPGAVMEDNSHFSLIDHGDLADFYDCHFYRDHDLYLNRIKEWRQFLKDHKPKPFVLGESIDNDTFRSLEWLEKKAGDEKHWWLPYCYNAQKRLRTQLITERGKEAWEKLIPHSYAHSLVSRKYQLEVFRSIPETSGYVITSIRDIRPTAPGMYTDSGDLKWKPADWRQFNSDSVLLISPPGGQFVIESEKEARTLISFSHFGRKDIANGVLRCDIKPLDRYKEAFAKIDLPHKSFTKEEISLKAGETKALVTLPLKVQKVQIPIAFQLHAEISETETRLAQNDWTLWVFPSDQNKKPAKEIGIYSKEATDHKWGVKLENLAGLDGVKVLVTDQFNKEVLAFLKNGGRVIHLADGGKWPRLDLFFWRETVAIMPPHPAFGNFPCDEIIDMQFTRMAQRKMLLVSDFNDKIQPIIEVVNCRKMTRGTLVFETRVGKGTLFVSVLRHQGRDNLEGSYLLGQFAMYLLQADKKPGKEFPVDKLESYLDK